MHTLSEFSSYLIRHWYVAIKFVIVGTTAMVANLSVVYLATETLGWWYLSSSVVGFIVGITISFIFQKLWTFGDNSTARVTTQAALFLAIALTGLALNSISVWTQVEFFGVHYLAAQLISGAFIAIANFILYRTLIFSLSAIVRVERLLEHRLTQLLIWPALFVFTAVVTRISGLTLPYYQDEWKYARAVSEGTDAASGLYHPPLTELLYFLNGYLFGTGQLRMLPVLFFAASVLLLFTILYRRADLPSALLGSTLYLISAYGFVGSLMIDTDGAILPFFFLLSVFAYDRWCTVTGKRKTLYALLLAAAVLLGFLVKLAFIIVFGALAVDWLFTNARTLRVRSVIFIGGAGALIASLFALVVFVVTSIKPTFDVVNMIEHARLYMHLGSRNYGQVVFQSAKALLYLSPLLVIPLLLVSRQEWRRYRLFFIYLFLGLVFYLVLFDFSIGALDKYFLFAIAPIAAIAGGVLARLLALADQKHFYAPVLIGASVSVGLFVLLAFPYDIMPLYPKRAWFEAFVVGHWDLLLPFMGGSGPPPFYMPLLFLVVAWFIVAVTAVAAWFQSRFSVFAAVVLILVGITYNSVFVAEYLFGNLYGSSSSVLEDAIQYIEEEDTIDSVVTYNDYGAFELWKMGKYKARFYADPANEAAIRERFVEYDDSAFLIVDLPRLNPEQFYGEFISSCKPLYVSIDKSVSATIYDCKAAVGRL